MDILFLFKKIVGPLFFPVSIGLILLGLGLIFLWFTRKQRPARCWLRYALLYSLC